GIKINLFGKGWKKTKFKKYYSGYLNDKNFNKIINQSKINISPLKSGDKSTLQVKGRLFEVAACNSFQLAEKNELVNDFFIEEKEIITYSDYDDLLEKIKYFLNNEAERNNIAQNAYRRVIAEHTWKKRLTHIFETIEKSKEKRETKSSGTNVNIIINFKTNNKICNSTITSINEQTHKNITLLSFGRNPLNYDNIEIPKQHFNDFAELTGNINSGYFAFIEDGDKWDKNKIFFQVFAVDNDIKDNIEINLCNFGIYHTKPGCEIIRYSFAKQKDTSDIQRKNIVPLSSIMITANKFKQEKDLFNNYFQNNSSDLSGFTKPDTNYRHIDLQESLVKISLSNIKKLLTQEKSNNYETNWSWADSGYKVILILLLKIKLKYVYKIISAQLNRKDKISTLLFNNQAKEK
ncbi:MAG: glycosyltransferase, partial [Bacteroidales bacterium]|nr:glycosyltransferase [Bacteroidales bacterium]